MRCFQLCWVIFILIFFGESEWMPSVSGMPMEQRFDGSTLCGLDFGRNAASKEYSRIALELIYKDTATVVANSTKCDLEFRDGAAQWKKLTGNEKRSFDRIEVRVTEGNPELLKIFVDKKDRGRLSDDVHSIIQIVCANRKFHGCIRFPSSKNGVMHKHRSLLSVDQDDVQKDDDDGIFLKPLLLISAGIAVLLLAGSLCTDCNENKDDVSISDAKPHLVSCQQRLSRRQVLPDEQQPEEEVVDESKIDIGTIEKMDQNLVEENNHTSQIPLSNNELPESTSTVQHVQHVLPNSTHPPELAISVHTSDSQPRPPSTEHVSPKDVDVVHPGTTSSEYETVECKTVSSKSGISKSKQGSEHEHDEHKGRFWKRTRSAKGISGSTSATDRSSDVFKDEEHKHRSRKESKETKTKTGKTKSRTGSSGSDKDEKHVLHESPIERPREKTPTLERHSRGLPLPPGPSVPPLPVVPIPQRHFSAPDEVEDDNNYETVEVRKTKSMERVKGHPPSPSDDAYDTVQVKFGKPRALSLDHDMGEDSGNYEVVAFNKSEVDYLYAEVQQSKNKETTNEKNVEDTVAEETEEDPEDPYSRIKNLKLKEEVAEMSEALEDAEDPYSSIKNDMQEDDLEVSNLYEDVEKQKENRVDKNHKYASVDKKEVFQLMIDTENSADSERNRSKSDTTGLKRCRNEMDKRANSVHVVRSRTGEAVAKGEVTQAKKATTLPRDDTYAKVDLSMKTRRRNDTESSGDTEEERHDTEDPPPLPPAYVSSRQMKIEMGRNPDNTDNLYDEVATAGQRDRTPSTELLMPQDDSNRLSSASGDYEPVETILKPVIPITKTSASDDYAEIPEPVHKSNASGSGSAGPVHLKVCNAPANISVTVTSSTEACAPMDDLEVQSGLQKVRVQKKAVQARLEHAESESTNLRKELEEVKSNLADTSKAYEVLKEQEPTWQESLEELRDLSEHQKAELEQDRLHIEHLMAALETRDKMIQDHTEEKQQLEEDLKSERETTASLQEQLTDAQTAAAQQQGQIEDMRCTIRGMQIELSCFEQKCSQQQLDNEQLQEELKQMEEVRICERQRLEEELEVIYQHHAMVVEESNAMRAELDRRNNTETQETQTETTASVLEEQLADANKLRVMIEELQMRFRDVLEKYRHRFGSDAKEVAIETGMDDFLRDETVFQRLYDDGLIRVARLEKLREKVRKERSKLGYADKEEASVLSTVEQSDLRGARQVLQGSGGRSDEKGYNPRSGSEAQHSPPRGPPETSQSRMNPSVSLPSLHATHDKNLNVMSLNLDSSHRGYRRYSK